MSASPLRTRNGTATEPVGITQDGPTAQDEPIAPAQPTAVLADSPDGDDGDDGDGREAAALALTVLGSDDASICADGVCAL